MCLLLQLECFNGNSSDSLGDELFYALFYSTSNISCFEHEISDSWEFNDLRNDERAGFLNRPQNSGFIDLLTGTYQNTSDSLKFTLTLREIPETLPANVYKNKSKPEYAWIFHLRGGESQFQIRITHFSKDTPQLILFSELIPLVWQDAKSIGGCGSIQISNNQLSWLCDKTSLPSLNDATSLKSISVESIHRKNENDTYDCY